MKIAPGGVSMRAYIDKCLVVSHTPGFSKLLHEATVVLNANTPRSASESSSASIYKIWRGSTTHSSSQIHVLPTEAEGFVLPPSPRTLGPL